MYIGLDAEELGVAGMDFRWTYRKKAIVGEAFVLREVEVGFTKESCGLSALCSSLMVQDREIYIYISMMNGVTEVTAARSVASDTSRSWDRAHGAQGSSEA